MKFAKVKFELDMQALLDAYFHFDRSILIWFCSSIRYYEFFLLCYAVVVSIDNNVDVVPKSDHNTVVAFKLLFYSVKLKIVLHIVT